MTGRRGSGRGGAGAGGGCRPAPRDGHGRRDKEHGGRRAATPGHRAAARARRSGAAPGNLGGRLITGRRDAAQGWCGVRGPWRGPGCRAPRRRRRSRRGGCRPPHGLGCAAESGESQLIAMRKSRSSYFSLARETSTMAKDARTSMSSVRHSPAPHKPSPMSRTEARGGYDLVCS